MKWHERIGCRIKLQDLHIFLTVAELGSMGKAAQRLAISQPSVSKAISDIERKMGVRLLDRTPQGWRLRPMVVPFLDEAWEHSMSYGED